MPSVATTGFCEALLVGPSSALYVSRKSMYYKIDYKALGISARGSICWFKYGEDPMVGYYLLSFETESAWSAPSEIFEAILKGLGNSDFNRDK